jgi:hypothetical protein
MMALLFSLCFFFLSFSARKMVRASSMAITATPTPIPARAPVLRPEDGGEEEGFAVGGLELVFGVDVVLEAEGVDDVAD